MTPSVNEDVDFFCVIYENASSILTSENIHPMNTSPSLHTAQQSVWGIYQTKTHIKLRVCSKLRVALFLVCKTKKTKHIFINKFQYTHIIENDLAKKREKKVQTMCNNKIILKKHFLKGKKASHVECIIYNTIFMKS